MEHPNLYPLRSIFRYQRTQQRSAGRIRGFSGPSQRIGEDRYFEIWVIAQGMGYRLDKLVLGFANVQCGKVNASLRVADFVL